MNVCTVCMYVCMYVTDWRDQRMLACFLSRDSVKNTLTIYIGTSQIINIPGDDAVHDALYNKHSKNIGKAEVIIR